MHHMPRIEIFICRLRNKSSRRGNPKRKVVDWPPFSLRCQRTRQVQIAVDSDDLGQTPCAHKVVGVATERD